MRDSSIAHAGPVSIKHLRVRNVKANSKQHTTTQQRHIGNIPGPMGCYQHSSPYLDIAGRPEREKSLPPPRLGRRICLEPEYSF